jgi:hypothetical protein
MDMALSDNRLWRRLRFSLLHAALRSRVVAPLRRARAPCLQRRSLATDRQSGYQTGPYRRGQVRSCYHQGTSARLATLVGFFHKPSFC